MNNCKVFIEMILCRFNDVYCKKLKPSILVIDKYMMDGFEFGIICLNFAI
ncbi:MAG: hypothetical protein PQ275_17290 [Elizabethkingia anophelis]|nr:hypothetical protein M876_16755 [Elizabethkingia anophelis FMS-007]EQB92389.1 hypothetical protein C874_05960 [Elizabethkingia anophelis 502]WMC07110.1 MAG: hypothetical protein PQ275_17290 [Elizabethkingia anophelis]BBQ07205.1 hypothetical protein JUNP353_1776 [Elizabethkingia anophelis]GJN63081.1 hypothetical protein ELAK_32310 [Elizabethkingia anophelis]